MSDSAWIAGVAGMFSFGGREWTVSVRTLDMEGLFSAWARREALREIVRSEKDIPPHVFAARLRHNADTAAFTFAWGSDGCEMARYSEPGIRYMFWLQLKRTDNSVSQADVDGMARDQTIRDLMVRYTLGDLDPNRQPPQPAGETPP